MTSNSVYLSNRLAPRALLAPLCFPGAIHCKRFCRKIKRHDYDGAHIDIGSSSSMVLSLKLAALLCAFQSSHLRAVLRILSTSATYPSTCGDTSMHPSPYWGRGKTLARYRQRARFPAFNRQQHSQAAPGELRLLNPWRCVTHSRSVLRVRQKARSGNATARRRIISRLSLVWLVAVATRRNSCVNLPTVQSARRLYFLREITSVQARSFRVRRPSAVCATTRDTHVLPVTNKSNKFVALCAICPIATVSTVTPTQQNLPVFRLRDCDPRCAASTTGSTSSVSTRSSTYVERRK